MSRGRRTAGRARGPSKTRIILRVYNNNNNNIPLTFYTCIFIIILLLRAGFLFSHPAHRPVNETCFFRAYTAREGLRTSPGGQVWTPAARTRAPERIRIRLTAGRVYRAINHITDNVALFFFFRPSRFGRGGEVAVGGEEANPIFDLRAASSGTFVVGALSGGGGSTVKTLIICAETTLGSVIVYGIVVVQSGEFHGTDQRFYRRSFSRVPRSGRYYHTVMCAAH